MSYNLKTIIVKAICILLFIIIFYILTDKSLYNKYESFEDCLELEKINYLKLNETYIEPQDKLSLDLLYANYSGEEVGKDVWEGKTLVQCTDICNKIDNCNGFTRDLVLDTEPAKCYPYNTVNKCYSNRKGDSNQMQKAIKYNSYVKSSVPNILNLCIGDSDLTLNRTIFIKSYKYPNTFLGANGDSRLVLIDMDSDNFKSSCNFRIEKGLDGVGTISFYHIHTGKYIMRDISNSIILKDIISNQLGQTENKQRSSFNLYDSTISSDTIMLKAMKMDGETTDKFITLDGNYLNVSQINTGASNDSSTFYIIDSIINSNIITNKQNIPSSTLSNTDKNSQQDSSVTIQENFIGNSNNQNYANNPGVLDVVTDLSLYNNLFNPQDAKQLQFFLEDNYSQNKNPEYMSIYNKTNDSIINKQLSDSLSKYSNEYNSNHELNLEIEKEISNMYLDLNGKNDKIINELDKMRISDMANDYFFLKNLTKTKN
jgi:hypothetical protein